MSSAYDSYVKAKIAFAEENEDLIAFVNKAKETPQHLLMAKTVSDKLENDEAKCLRKDGEFYFTEALVNKLMHFAYLKGQKGFEERSFAAGYASYRKEVATLLDLADEYEDRY